MADGTNGTQAVTADELRQLASAHVRADRAQECARQALLRLSWLATNFIPRRDEEGRADEVDLDNVEHFLEALSLAADAHEHAAHVVSTLEELRHRG